MSDAHTDQSRAEFEKWARGESPSINLTREGNGYRYSLAETLYDAWHSSRATTEQSSGVELPEPAAFALEWTFNGEERGMRLYDDETHCRFDAESDGGICHPLYTEQQVRALLAGVKDSLTAAPAVPQGWMPIESAPKDGTLIVVRGNNYGDSELGRHHCVASWHRGRWLESSAWHTTSELKYLTHWMPMPQPPKEQT